MAMTVERLGETFVARVTGIDVGKMSNSEAQDLHQAYLDHKILIIDGQELDVPQFAKFGELFGETVEHPVKNFLHPDYPVVMILSNSTQLGKPTGVKDAGSFWHSDRSYTERTADATMLYSVEIPDEGGDTFFGDLEAIYETMPGDLKRRVEGKTYVSQYRWTTNRGDPECRWSMITEEERAKTPPVVRPIVRTHPETGKKSLYVFPGVSAGVKGIVGMDAIDSADLLDEIFDHMMTAGFTYQYKWQGPGTIVLWDNRCVMHKASTKNLPPEKIRTLYRVSTLGEVPRYVADAAAE